MKPIVDRRRGRPRVAEPRSALTTWIWAKHHDRLVRIAAQREVSVSALVREILTKVVPPGSVSSEK